MNQSCLSHTTIHSLAQGIRKGDISPLELAEQCLSSIDSLDGELNAFRLVCRERAMKDAEKAQRELHAGKDLGPLHGIPYAAKDLFDVEGLPTTAGCSLLQDNIAMADATAIRSLREKGMVLLGKTNTVQFAYGGTGINHDHGTPHNPWHPIPHVPGGSSSGSAVAVASGMVPMALGSDTGGSVRIPSSLCGIVGLKPTVGRVSRAGVHPLSWTFDSVGPLCRSVEDVALVYQSLQGPDSRDDSTVGVPPHDVLGSLKDGIRGLRLAFPESVFWEHVDPEVEKAVRECGHVFRDLAARVDRLNFPEAEEAMRLNLGGPIITSEAYVINRKWLEQHFEQLDPFAALPMIRGKNISAAEYLQNVLDCKRLRAQVNHSLRDIDALLVPTTRVPALPISDLDVGIETYLKRDSTYVINTVIGNVFNLCGISIPCGFTSNGLPIGLMIYGKSFQEDVVLRVGYAFEQATAWHKQRPDLGWVRGE